MGALLQLVGMQKKPSQALIKAPSADLIKSDNELSPPEPTEIGLEMEPEKLESYVAITKTYDGFSKKTIKREQLLHFLKSDDFRVYDRLKVLKFMERYINHASYNLKLGDDLWWAWIDLKEYRHPLPHRVVNSIKTISTSHKDAEFFVSDIFLVTKRYYRNFNNTDKHIGEREVIPMKRKTEICFLRVNANGEDTLPQESLIIDAWRGPTFSDEEAKI